MDLSRRIEIGPAGGTPSRVLALALLAALLALVALGVVLPLRMFDGRLGEEIAHYQRVLAAHQAIAERKNELTRAAGASDPRAMAELLMADTSDTAAAAALHERARELIAAVRGNPISIQALPAAEIAGGQGAAQAGYRRIGLRVQFAADLPGFQRIVHALEGGRPAVLVTNLYLRARTARAAGVANPLDVQMDLIAFRRGGQG